ncbi:MAG: hypothetical protein WBX14_11090 [Candidatus Udaeobacter sp.]
MSEEQKRGSSKLGAMSSDDLHKAIGAARESYKIERWWKYGQPAIDRISAVLDITNVATAGSIIGNIIKMQGAERQIGVVVFPYGIPVFDGVRLEVNIDQVSH